MKGTIVVGSRQSHLALTQTQQVLDKLRKVAEELGYDLRFEIKKIVTRGDRILDVTLSKVGGKGLFVKEIEQAMLDGSIDMAIHSMKDMPAQFPSGLVHAATPKRVDPRDCLISKGNLTLDELPKGAKVGTSSLRRAAQIKAYRPDLEVQPVRGNIETRLNKLETEGFDAIILASAGLERVGWSDKASQRLSPHICLPAVGQGALGIECRESDDALIELLQHINHDQTAVTVQAERSFLRTLNGGCHVPIAAYAVLADDKEDLLELTGMVGTPDGLTLLKESATGKDPETLGVTVAQALIEQGADRILEEVGKSDIQNASCD